MAPDNRRLPATRAEIAALIPHQGTMCLLESVADWSEESIVCTTRSHASPDNPLRRDGQLSALHLCEYGAQAMALHGGLSTQDALPKPGWLVALRDVQLAIARVESAGILHVRAQRLHASEAGWLYEFSVSNGDGQLASGRATVMLRRST
jgi:predicted hotdog family 3-hydroxylacyl-ACP dehydratase